MLWRFRVESEKGTNYKFRSAPRRGAHTGKDKKEYQRAGKQFHDQSNGVRDDNTHVQTHAIPNSSSHNRSICEEFSPHLHASQVCAGFILPDHGALFDSMTRVRRRYDKGMTNERMTQQKRVILYALWWYEEVTTKAWRRYDERMTKQQYVILPIYGSFCDSMTKI